MKSREKKRIRFHFQKPFRLPDRKNLKLHIEKVFEYEKKSFETLDYIFCSDDYLLSINQEYLNHDDFTDIISFDLSSKGSGIAGEIYVSIDRVSENAEKFQVPFLHELYRVCFHGALHLCGYKDKKPSDQQVMRKMEEKHLKGYLQH
jgi:probable rRNA maturation factor